MSIWQIIRRLAPFVKPYRLSIYSLVSGEIRHRLNVGPLMDPLRNDPRFKAMVRQMGLSE